MKEVRPRIVKNYTTPDGQKPFQEWVRGLSDTKVRGRVRSRIDRLKDGNFGDCKRRIAGGVGELRIDIGPGYRIYFGEMKNIIVILLCGGSKSTQKRDIKKAEEYWQDAKSNS